MFKQHYCAGYYKSRTWRGFYFITGNYCLRRFEWCNTYPEWKWRYCYQVGTVNEWWNIVDTNFEYIKYTFVFELVSNYIVQGVRF